MNQSFFYPSEGKATLNVGDKIDFWFRSGNIVTGTGQESFEGLPVLKPDFELHSVSILTSGQVTLELKNERLSMARIAKIPVFKDISVGYLLGFDRLVLTAVELVDMHIAASTSAHPVYEAL